MILKQLFVHNLTKVYLGIKAAIMKKDIESDA